ncbi:MAG: response regulator transcription factor [Myxococcota bacterium]|nr:response regulator transcription factor [Myxococcota bacterium]
MSVRIMLVDDHPLFRLGLRLLLQKEDDFSIVAEVDNPNTAWEDFQQINVDLVICDLSFQEGSGLSLVRRIRDSGSECPILILSMHDESFWAERVLQEGVNGYLMKDQNITTVIQAARSILTGNIYLSPSIQQKIFRQISGMSAGEISLRNLSGREDEVFQCMAQSMTTKEIAKTLYISVKTVQTHQANIKKKLKLDSLADLRMLAIKYSESDH